MNETESELSGPTVGGISGTNGIPESVRVSKTIIDVGISMEIPFLRSPEPKRSLAMSQGPILHTFCCRKGYDSGLFFWRILCSRSHDIIIEEFIVDYCNFFTIFIDLLTKI